MEEKFIKYEDIKNFTEDVKPEETEMSYENGGASENIINKLENEIKDMENEKNTISKNINNSTDPLEKMTKGARIDNLTNEIEIKKKQIKKIIGSN